MLAAMLIAGTGSTGPLLLNVVAASLSVYLSARLLEARGMLDDSTTSPVAINDPELTSYGNENHAPDLWGLIRKKRAIA